MLFRDCVTPGLIDLGILAKFSLAHSMNANIIKSHIFH